MTTHIYAQNTFNPMTFSMDEVNPVYTVPADKVGEVAALFHKEIRRIAGNSSATLGAEFKAELSKLIPNYMDILGAAAYVLFAYRGDNNGNPVYHDCNGPGVDLIDFDRYSPTGNKLRHTLSRAYTGMFFAQ